MRIIGVFEEQTDAQIRERIIVRIKEKHPEFDENKIKAMTDATMRNYYGFQEYEVSADSVEDFINKYGKPRQYSERGTEYMECVLQSHTNDLHTHGYTFITRHDSKLGDTVSYYGRKALLGADDDACN